MTSAKVGSAQWAFAAIMFLAYPILRPYSSEVGMEGAEAFGETSWVIAHVCAMLGFIAIALAMRSLEQLVGPSAGASAASVAVVVTWIGVGLTLAYYGAEAFALNALGAKAVSDADPAIMELADPIRNGAVQISMFGIGLLLVLIGGVYAALAVRSSGILPSWSGLPLAAGLILFAPQFFAPPAVRIAHGVLMFVGCLILAWAFWKARTLRTDLVTSAA
ncbi:hypothetical protein [Rhodococcoides yunnanense]|uniref:hypothetical protein n=1 Tax=Rhodococcoides yunnanense TaxID=278209 RepID=UPI0022B1F43B|nr:hypothetical protein [Rhodococcus yunnanensis]MCZ4275351.1 hypothetical protein [Rhodococcus yunnanensis]